MRSSQRFAAEPAVTSIVHGQGQSPNIFTTPGNIQQYSTVMVALSGACTAATLKTLLNITGGGGWLDVFAVSSVDATSRTHRIKITIDGAVVPAYETTSVAYAAANLGMIAVGIPAFNSAGNVTPVALPTRFNSSCLIEYASSVTETDKTNIFYAYRLT